MFIFWLLWRFVRTVLLFLGAAVAVAVVVAVWSEYRFESSTLAISTELSGTDESTERVVIEVPDDDGVIYVKGAINGVPTEFQVDTGASKVVILSNQVDEFKLRPLRPEAVRTATGRILAARTIIDSISVGKITLTDVRGLIFDPTSAGFVMQPLLGMSFLSRLKRFEFRPGLLILEQERPRK